MASGLPDGTGTPRRNRMENARPRIMTALFRDPDSAERAYGALTSRGYGRDEVSLLMSEGTNKRHFRDKDVARTDFETKAAEGAGAGAVAGGGAGGRLAAPGAARLVCP